MTNIYGEMSSASLRTLEQVLDAEFRTGPTPTEVEAWRQERDQLRQQLAEAQRREALLRAVAEAAAGYNRALITLNKSKSQEDADIAYQWLYKWERTAQAAIDGGAMEE